MFKAIKHLLYLYDIGAMHEKELSQALNILASKTKVNVSY